MTVGELFDHAKLSSRGPVQWETEISESCAGVYVVALTQEVNIRFECPDYLKEHEQRRWLPNEPIVYIGQTTDQTLARRIRQFYRHTYGNKSPHRGGQAIKLLRCDLWLYWSPAPKPKESERIMLNAFIEKIGHLPFANRRR